MRFSSFSTLVITTTLVLGHAVAAQSLDVPITVPPDDGEAGVCATSTVAGLDPAGDGFLSVRSGPGTEYRKIGELYNGDVVAVCNGRGSWRGVFYGSQGRATQSGWVHGNWLRDLAG